MRTILIAGLMASLGAGSSSAANNGGHTYKKVAAVPVLMEYMVKPAMDKIKAFREAGGPSDKDEWKEAYEAITVVNEASQLVLMDGRIKDDVWADGASQVAAGARDAAMGAYRMDPDGYNGGLKAMSAGCKTCHDVHKKKKE